MNNGCDFVSESSNGIVTYCDEYMRQKEAASSLADSATCVSCGNSLADELEKLADLTARGVLTEKEFIAAKAKLLS
jgi:hypothetical protein